MVSPGLELGSSSCRDEAGELKVIPQLETLNKGGVEAHRVFQELLQPPPRFCTYDNDEEDDLIPRLSCVFHLATGEPSTFCYVI